MQSENMQYAIERLKTAKSVEHWNEIRSRLKDSLTTQELLTIDSGGLIVEVLGKDPINHY